MSSVRRILVENACYHLMVRGNQKQKVFRDEQDFRVYLKRLKRYKTKAGFRLYGYCLMPNHVHIVGEVSQSKNLAKFMQRVNRSYTAYFNKKYDKVGHLWQGRFKSKVITKDKYLIDCIQYLEFNPVRANLSNTAAEYKWSSFLERTMNQSVNSITDAMQF